MHSSFRVFGILTAPMSLPGCGGFIGVSWTSLCHPLLPGNLVTAPLGVQQLDSLGKVLSVLQALAAPSVREGQFANMGSQVSIPAAALLSASLSPASAALPPRPLSSKSCWALGRSRRHGSLSLRGTVSPGNCLPVSFAHNPRWAGAASDCRATPAAPSVASAIAMGTDVDPWQPWVPAGLPLSWPAQLPAGRTCEGLDTWPSPNQGLKPGLASLF